MGVSTGLLFLLSLSSVSGLILPLTKPNGEPDVSSIVSHLTLMEQTMTSLQIQLQTTNSKLQATEIELTTVKANHQATEAKLQLTEDELKVVKADLTTAKTDIAILKHDLQKGPDPVELTNMKSEFETLKKNYNSLVLPINSTVIDSISSDVKSSIKDIQALNTRQNNTEKDLTATKSLVQSAVSDVKIMQTQANIISGDVNSLCQKVSAMKIQNVADQSKQNITEQVLTATKALAQSASAEVKSIKSQVNTITGDVNAINQDLAAIKNKTDEDAAFQVTQRGSNSNGWTTLKFDTVDYNINVGYNKTSGVFTAPVSGTYILWANVRFYSPIGEHLIYIHKKQQQLASGYDRMSNDHDQGVASTMTVTHLDKGDQVHFTTHSTKTYINGGGLSSYGGALLHAT